MTPPVVGRNLQCGCPPRRRFPPLDAGIQLFRSQLPAVDLTSPARIVGAVARPSGPSRFMTKAWIPQRDLPLTCPHVVSRRALKQSSLIVAGRIDTLLPSAG